ncbi:hypothetical protein EJB05_19518 [Eragrostis curvula]|uniref:Uncharacterized protein n=1 Tax=Eragrostis curvula TaxID=38414 RepID=A0A5J9UVX9_9POAL|nr:hypothetical protein EJB05_19518 [Eragrostis curvula]
MADLSRSIPAGGPLAAPVSAAPTLDLEAELQLAGTVPHYERHVFLCYDGPDWWPDRIEDADPDCLPGCLDTAIKARRPNLKKITRFNICEGKDGSELSNGDVLIFPDMIQYKGLTCSDVNDFVEEDTCERHCVVSWISSDCVDKRCHIFGPSLIRKFLEEIKVQRLRQLTVSACSHVGGDKYSGNIIIFGPDSKGQGAGHWYGLVLPCAVRYLLCKHITRREIVDELWRGQMGLTKEQQKEALKLRNRENARSSDLPKEKHDESVLKDQNQTSSRVARFETRERAWTALAVVSAAAVVFFASRVYKNPN